MSGPLLLEIDAVTLTTDLQTRLICIPEETSRKKEQSTVVLVLFTFHRSKFTRTDSSAATARTNSEIPFHLTASNYSRIISTVCWKKLNQKANFSPMKMMFVRLIIAQPSISSRMCVHVCVCVCWKRNLTNGDQAKRKLSCNHTHFININVYRACLSLNSIMKQLKMTTRNEMMKTTTTNQQKIDAEQKTMKKRKQ